MASTGRAAAAFMLSEPLSSWAALVDNANGDEMKTTTLQPRASNATTAASPWAVNMGDRSNVGEHVLSSRG